MKCSDGINSARRTFSNKRFKAIGIYASQIIGQTINEKVNRLEKVLKTNKNQ